nr:MAG TPA: hypothetical protein [Caudoviricetes sp.]
MKYTEKDLYKGMKLRCIDDGLYDFWTEGAIYTVEESTYGGLIIRGEGDRSDRPTYDILNYLNGKTLVKMEIVEEEKQVTKYVEITKLIDWSRDPELLEVGKVYKVEAEYKESMYLNGVSIYINENESCYYLRSDQFKFVDEPVAEIKVDTLEVIEAKIEQLANEQENLYNKRMRIKEQEEALREKRMKLKEAKKALEFLKKQNYL